MRPTCFFTNAGKQKLKQIKLKQRIKANTGDSDKLINAPGTYNTPDKIKVENIKPQKTSKVTGAIGSETRRKQYDALNYKYDDTIKV